MNKLKIVDGVLKEINLDDSIAITDNGLHERFNINSYTIYVHETTELEIDYAKTDLKIELNINLDADVSLSLYEIKECLKTKVKYQYNLFANSYLKVKKFNNNHETKEMNIINLNGTNAKVDFFYKTIATNQETVDVIVNHSIRETTSNIICDGVTIEEGLLNLTVTTIIPNGCTNCNANQENEIINLNDKTNTIKPLLLIEENEVNASHSAKIGTFNENDLFYLMSRGLETNKAKKLLIKGFLTKNIEELDIIDKYINKYWR